MKMQMLLVLCLGVFSLPLAAQFRTIEIKFEGIGCESCIESLPTRMQRLRGVTSAHVDKEKQSLKLELAAANRVRIEQVRDAIQQDGTKTISALVHVVGDVSQQDGKQLLTLPGAGTSYEVAGATAKLDAGKYSVQGRIANLRPESGRIVIEAAEITPER